MRSTAFITGATNRIGLKTARSLAKQGWRVVIVGRNVTRGTEAVRLIASHARKTAQTMLYLATDEAMQEIIGSYFVNIKTVKSSATPYDEQAQKKLWQVSAAVTHVHKDYGLGIPVKV